MLIRVTRVEPPALETVEICCYRISEEVQEIAAFVKSRQGQLSGVLEGRQYEIAVGDIEYIESVENRSYLYTKKQVYESSYRLYELEKMLREKHFLRISKSMLLNLMKVQAIRPSLNSRFTAVLYSGEQVVISRKYAPGLRKALKGGT